jgi:hypothetical protein
LTREALSPYQVGAESKPATSTGRGLEMLKPYFAIASALSFALLASAAPASAAAMTSAMSYCKADVARLCPGIEPGGGRIVGCLKEHKMEVSVGCAKAVQKMRAQMGK